MKDLNITCEIPVWVQILVIYMFHLLLCMPCIQKMPYSFSSVDMEEKEKGVNNINKSQFLAGVAAIFLVYKNNFVLLFSVKT